MGKHAFWVASFQCLAKKLYTRPLYTGRTVPGNLKSYSIDRPELGLYSYMSVNLHPARHVNLTKMELML